MADKFYIMHRNTPKQGSYKILFITQTGYSYNIVTIVSITADYATITPMFGIEYSKQFKQLGVGRADNVSEEMFLSCLDNIDNIRDLYKNLYFPDDKRLKRVSSMLKGIEFKTRQTYQISYDI